jgi:tetratricopeptide (TPR) repeat protein
LIDRAIAIDPQMAWPHRIRGMALRGLKRHREAIAAFARCLELDPQNGASTLDWRARTFADIGEHRAAAEDRLRLVREFPNGQHSTMGVSPLDWSECAEALALAGEPARAIEVLGEYLARHADRADRYRCDKAAPLRLLARLVREAGDPVRATELEAKALKYPGRYG